MTEEEFVLQWVSRQGDAVNRGIGSYKNEVEFVIQQAQSLYREIKRIYAQSMVDFCEKEKEENK